MKPFIIALTLYLFVNISSCSTNDAPIVEPPNGETAEDSRSEDCGAGALRAAGGTHVQTHGAGTGPRDGEAVEGGLSGRL